MMKNFLSILLSLVFISPTLAQEGEGKQLYLSAASGEFTEAVNSFTSASEAVCLADAKTSDNNSFLDELISKGFKSDPSCQKVFTGNKGDYEDADESYAKTFAYSIAQDMCSGGKTGSLADILEQPEIKLNYNSAVNKGESWDVFSIPKFADRTKKQKSPDNLVATYALVYSLGLRESSGNFNEGTYNNHTPLTEESGLVQISANSLNADGVPKESSLVLRSIFSKYVTGLIGKTKEEQASICLADKINGSKKSKKFDSSGTSLHAMLNNGVCGQVKDSIAKSNFKVTDSVAQCFSNLSKMCPSFHIKYGAASARLRRFGHGPLMTRDEHENRGRKSDVYKKDLLEPACHSLFKSIVENKDKICSEMGGSSSTSVPDISSEVSSKLANSNGEVELGDGFLGVPVANVVNPPLEVPIAEATTSQKTDNDESTSSTESSYSENINSDIKSHPKYAPLIQKKSISEELDEEKLATRVQNIENSPTINQCASGVRKTLNALFGKSESYGDIDPGGPVSINAKDYDQEILSQWQTKSLKYVPVAPDGTQQKYEIRVHRPNGICKTGSEGDKYGHIEIYVPPKGWFSDHKQAGSSLGNPCYTTTIYRLGPK